MVMMSQTDHMEQNNFQAFHYIQNGIFILNSQNEVVFWNEYLATETNIPSAEIEGHSIIEYFPHFAEPLFINRLNQVWHQGIPYVFSAQLHRYVIPIRINKDAYQIQQTTVTPILDPESNQFHALFVIQDITELSQRIQQEQLIQDQLIKEVENRIIAEQQLREQQHFLDQILDNIPGIVYILDISTKRLTFVNRVVKRILGYTSDEIRQMSVRTISNLIHPDDLSIVVNKNLALATKTVKEGDEYLTYEISHRVQHPDGSWRWLNLRETIFETDDFGRIKSVLGIAMDVTYLRKIEETATNALVQSEHAKLISRLVESISHEFRTPLSSIHLSAELLQRLEKPEDRSRHLKRINQHIMIINEKLEQLDELVQYSYDKPISPQPIQLNHFLKKYLQIFIDQQLQNQIIKLPTFQIETSDKNLDLKLLHSDENMLWMALQPILHNAMLYTDTSHFVHISCNYQFETIQIIIEDEGQGIDAEHLPHIFEPFYKADVARTSNHSRNGLGLTISRRIVKILGGEIDIESQPQQGTTVTITLPQHTHYIDQPYTLFAK